MNKINKQILLYNGFTNIDKSCRISLKHYFNKYITHEDSYNINVKGFLCNDKDAYFQNYPDLYVIDVYDANLAYYISIKDISNTVNRNWNVHIDNKDFETIASVDIETVEHFNMLMKLMDINFRLKEE